MRKQLVFLNLFLGLLIFSSCSTNRKITKKLNDTFHNSEFLENGYHGFIVYDPADQKVLYQHNSARYFTPASNTKLFTFYTGLKVLGDSIAAIRYTIQGDTLFFGATGDPTFLHEDFPSSPVLDFLKNRQETLVYIPATYKETHFGPGWAWGDYNWYYSPERGAFPIYGNYVSMTFTPGRDQPTAFPSYFQDSLNLEATYNRQGSGVMRDLKTNSFVYWMNPQSKERTQDVPFVYSESLAVKLLSDTLDREIHIKKDAPKSLKLTSTVYSIAADSLYKPMLQRSDNFFAEQILLMSAESLSDSLKTDIAIDYMMEHHLDDLPNKPQWRDGSGLSRYNLFTPRSMVKLLDKIQQEVPQDRLFELLPAGGVSGTLRNSYKAQEPYVFAKTGTLNNNHSLSGYLKTKSGKIFIFSFMNSNYVSRTSDVKKDMEHVLRTIHENY